MGNYHSAIDQKTPSINVLDNRRRNIRTLEYLCTQTDENSNELITLYEFNIQGFQVKGTDPRKNKDQSGPNFTRIFNLAGNVLREENVDAGQTITLNDIEGRPVFTINATGVRHNHHYEGNNLPGRLLTITEQIQTEEKTIERLIWAGNTTTEKNNNLAGQCIYHYDTAGLIQLNNLSLTGAISSQSQQLLIDSQPADWTGENQSIWQKKLSHDIHTTQNKTDATGALLTQTDAKGNIQRLTYDVAGQLKGSWLTLKGQNEQIIVKSLTYSAAGQKLREEHGNGIITEYAYEPETQRLIGITTHRLSDNKILQDLRYEYDPVGNVISISNDAEATRFWRNQKVVPKNTYAYDSLYQLISATGREMANIGQQNHRLPSPVLPSDNNSYTNYTRHYSYDHSGNLLQIRHNSSATQNSYTRGITISNRSNRGVISTLTTDPNKVDTLFDAGGHQTSLLPGQTLIWTPQGELKQVNNGTGNEWYRYGRDGIRRLKVSEQQTQNSTQQQRVTYLPGLELRITQNSATTTENLQVITVGKAGYAQARVLHWESGKPKDISNNQLRYSYDNLIGSSQLELDHEGQIISQEEYYPFGGTALWAANNQTEASYKTIRYSGKERDATGLYYYGYRYYQSWSGRWLSADPAGTVDGLNLYRMVRNNPISAFDDNGLMFSKAVIKGVTSAIAAAGGLGYEAYKHANKPSETPAIEQQSISSVGNNKIHAQHLKAAEKQQNFSLLDTVKKNFSGRGKVFSDAAEGKLPAHDSVMNERGNIAALYEFSKTGNISQLDKTSLLSNAVQDAKENIPTRFKQATKALVTVGTTTPEGVKELAETAKKTIDVMEDTAIVGGSIALAGNAAITAAKVAFPVASIPLTIAQAAWVASSVGKTVNDVNDVAKKHIEKSEITHNARTDLLTQVKQINKENRQKIIFGKNE